MKAVSESPFLSFPPSPPFASHSVSYFYNPLSLPPLPQSCLAFSLDIQLMNPPLESARSHSSTTNITTAHAIQKLDKQKPEIILANHHW